jgi:hypothetical protein
VHAIKLKSSVANWYQLVRMANKLDVLPLTRNDPNLKTVPTPNPGRPTRPNQTDARRLPDGASMVGEHAFAGDGVVDGLLRGTFKKRRARTA